MADPLAQWVHRCEDQLVSDRPKKSKFTSTEASTRQAQNMPRRVVLSTELDAEIVRRDASRWFSVNHQLSSARLNFVILEW